LDCYGLGVLGDCHPLQVGVVVGGLGGALEVGVVVWGLDSESFGTRLDGAVIAVVWGRSTLAVGVVALVASGCTVTLVVVGRSNWDRTGNSYVVVGGLGSALEVGVVVWGLDNEGCGTRLDGALKRVVGAPGASKRVVGAPGASKRVVGAPGALKGVVGAPGALKGVVGAPGALKRGGSC
jgi:hypothetical protein